MRTGTVVFLAVLLGAASPLVAQRPLKVYISADMEGVAGVVSGRQVSASGAEHGSFRKQLTEEVNAAVQAAREAGATQILVSDSHGAGQNLIPELLDPGVRLVRGFPRPLDMLEGLDSTFDAAMFIGYHAGEASLAGTLAHTMSGSRIAGIRLNGQEVSEGSFNAAMAGHFGVPVVMVSGDEATAEELGRVIGEVEAAVVKRSLGRQAAVTVHPTVALDLIRDAAKKALGELERFEPFVVRTPITLEITFKGAGAAEVADFFPEVERISAHTVRYLAPDMPSAARLIVGLMFLSDGS